MLIYGLAINEGKGERGGRWLQVVNEETQSRYGDQIQIRAADYIIKKTTCFSSIFYFFVMAMHEGNVIKKTFYIV